MGKPDKHVDYIALAECEVAPFEIEVECNHCGDKVSLRIAADTGEIRYGCSGGWNYKAFYDVDELLAMLEGRRG